ncbi:hypothetical protein E8E15_001518 [Penicillium rubens]|nr:hypothetical protein E8E15_001518 [Penicillium rubens]
MDNVINNLDFPPPTLDAWHHPREIPQERFSWQCGTMKGGHIIDWLSRLDPSAGGETTLTSALNPTRTDKNQQHEPPSPPESRKRRQIMTDGFTPTPKSQRVDGDVIDVQKLREQAVAEGDDISRPLHQLPCRPLRNRNQNRR